MIINNITYTEMVHMGQCYDLEVFRGENRSVVRDRPSS